MPQAIQQQQKIKKDTAASFPPKYHELSHQKEYDFFPVVFAHQIMITKADLRIKFDPEEGREEKTIQILCPRFHCSTRGKNSKSTTIQHTPTAFPVIPWQTAAKTIFFRGKKMGDAFWDGLLLLLVFVGWVIRFPGLQPAGIPTPTAHPAVSEALYAIAIVEAQ